MDILKKYGIPEDVDQCDIENCDLCKLKNQIISDLTSAVINNEITIRKAMFAISALFYDAGYKDSLVNDIEDKCEILDMLDGNVEEE